jgi:uncharacterized protein (TIGR03083 family)
MTSLPADSYDLATLLAAWEESLHAIAELGRRLTPEQWLAPTECPGWNAGDIVRHTSWVEGFLAGRRDPDHLVEWDERPHVANDFGRLTETGVDVRRHLDQAATCEELDGLIDVRLSQLMSLDPFALDTEVTGLFGRPVPVRNLLRVRLLDAWTHEQDIRRATALPAHLASLPATVAAAQLAGTLPFVLSRNVEAPIGTTMRLTVTGPIAFECWAAVDEEGRGIELNDLDRPDTDATIGLTTDWETYARLGTGRLDVTATEVLARCQLHADPTAPDAEELAARIPEALAITP